MTDPLKQFKSQTWQDGCGVPARLVNWLGRKDFVGYRGLSIVFTYWPNLDKEDSNVVWAWLDDKGRKQGKAGRMPIKPGKLFRRMFPSLTDKELEKLVDDYKESFFTPGQKLLESFEVNDIVNAYRDEQSTYQNIDTTYWVKSLANSCMRGKQCFENLPFHPSRAYGSGEFSILVVRDNKNKVSARCLVWHDPESNSYSAPIYSANNEATKMIIDYIISKGYKKQKDSWEGAKLLRIDYGNSYIAPYLDFEPQLLEPSGCGEYLVIDSDGSIDASAYEGVLGSNCTCCECEDRISNGDERSHEGYTYCESCFNDSFTYCEYDSEYYTQDEMVEVYTCNRYTETWHESNAQLHATYIVRLGDYYSDDLVFTDVNGEDFIESELNTDWFESAWSNDYYPLDEMVSVDEGLIGQSELPKNYVYNESDGIWEESESEDDS